MPNLRLAVTADAGRKHVLIYKVEGLLYPEEAEIIETSRNEWRIRHANAASHTSTFEERVFATPQEALDVLQAAVNDSH